MNKRIRELRKQVKVDHTKFSNDPKFHEKHVKPLADIFMEGDNAVLNEYMTKFAELIVRECIKELREAEQEADRAYKAKEVKERNTFNGYDFADMLEERFGVEE